MEPVFSVNRIIRLFCHNVEEIIFLDASMRLKAILVVSAMLLFQYPDSIVISMIVGFLMIMDVSLVNVGIIWLQKEIANLLPLDVWDMKKVYAKIVYHIINWKVESVKFKDVLNIQEIIVKNVVRNMI